MQADDLDDGGATMVRRLVGVVISVVLVSEYIVLGAMTLMSRALLGVAAQAWSRLLPPDPPRRDVGAREAEVA